MFAIFDLSEPLSFALAATTALTIFVILVLSYFFTTVPLHFAFDEGGHDAVAIQDKKAPQGQIKREIFWSVMSMLQGALFTTLLLVLWRLGAFPNFYLEIDEYGWGYFAFSLLVVMLIYDFMFYASHRLLHTKRFAKYHAIHHRSKVPTAFAMYCFHPVEAFIHSVRLPIILLVMPLSPWVILIAEGFLSNFVNAYGHLNYEPKFLKRVAWLHRNSACTGTFHNLHHSNGRGNFGFYLRFWDRVSGTLLPNTDQEVARVQKAWSN